ncbi:MAG TPA: hypothetical protein VIJ00_00640 [Nakamurella sp.]
MSPSGPQPRSGTRRWIVVTGVAAFVVLYAGLAIAYLANGSQSVDAGTVVPRTAAWRCWSRPAGSTRRHRRWTSTSRSC